MHTQKTHETHAPQVDGFLIGISAASGTNAGVIMAIALTIEMGFLSLTFASTLMPQKRHVFIGSCLLPPLTLLLGGLVGARAGAPGPPRFVARFLSGRREVDARFLCGRQEVVSHTTQPK